MSHEERERRASGPVNLMSAPVVLHPCREPACDRPALLARCELHTRPDDRDRLRWLDRAIVEAASAEEALLAAQRRVLELEAELGIERRWP